MRKSLDYYILRLFGKTGYSLASTAAQNTAASALVFTFLKAGNEILINQWPVMKSLPLRGAEVISYPITTFFYGYYRNGIIGINEKLQEKLGFTVNEGWLDVGVSVTYGLAFYAALMTLEGVPADEQTWPQVVGIGISAIAGWPLGKLLNNYKIRGQEEFEGAQRQVELRAGDALVSEIKSEEQFLASAICRFENFY